MDMNRRSFLSGLVSCAALDVLQHPEARAVAVSDSAVVSLEDEQVRWTFDRQSGALLLLENKQTGWRIQNGPTHSSGFRLHVPLPNRSVHFVTEKGNPLADLKVAADGKSLEMTWAELRTPHAGRLDITIRTSLALTEAGLICHSYVENRSKYPVDSISFPVFADLRAPGNGTKLEEDNWSYGGMDKTPLLPNFPDGMGYWGVDFPTYIANNWIPWNFILVSGEQEGLYVAAHESKLRDKVMFEFQLHPGYVNSFDESAIDYATKRPGRLTLNVIQFLFASPNSSKYGQTIVVSPYRGTWHAGADLYRKWRSTWWRAPISPSWAEDVVSWQQIQINSSEDRLLFPYKDLTTYAADCAQYGVKAIQLTGWNVGGQDRGYPCFDTDPRLGTAEDLRNAIDKSRKMGVEIILFNKYVYSDITTDWWKRELYKYAAMDPYGMPYGLGGGDQYQTPIQLSDINTRRLAVMCTACKTWQQIAKREFLKNIDLHAGGILYDEVCHHGPADYCFSPDHGHPVPTYLYSADVPFAENFRGAVDPEKFLFAGEAPYDQELTCYRVYYTRISPGHVAIQRYIDSQLPIMIAATGMDDRLMLNRALLHRYNISYEPRNFKGRLSEFPQTMAYGGKIDALRRRYRRFLWDGEYRDTLNVKVTGDDGKQPLYSVFVDRASGKRAVVLANEGHTQAATLNVMIPNASQLTIATPEEPRTRFTSAQILVPPESAAVVMEL
ncbi:MAG: DUF6259 domain-containing protein [Acidobacteriaceae bacterium]